MSVSTSGLAKELKTLLGAETNAEVLQRVQKLRRPQQPAVVVVVRWQPGEPTASLTVIEGDEMPLASVAEALRRGEAGVMERIEQIALQAQSEAAKLRAQLKGSAAEGQEELQK